VSVVNHGELQLQGVGNHDGSLGAALVRRHNDAGAPVPDMLLDPRAEDWLHLSANYFRSSFLPEQCEIFIFYTAWYGALRYQVPYLSSIIADPNSNGSESGYGIRIRTKEGKNTDKKEIK
jgi:hypothetical protein